LLAGKKTLETFEEQKGKGVGTINIGDQKISGGCVKNQYPYQMLAL
jgi:hypothetical protein